MDVWDVVASVYIITEKTHTAQLQSEIDHTILGCKDTVTGGAVVMKDDTGVLVRLLGKDTESVKSITNDVVKCARKIILGAPFTDVRKN